MKVELKYFRFANSNDAIFKTDLASLKFDASQFKSVFPVGFISRFRFDIIYMN